MNINRRKIVASAAAGSIALPVLGWPLGALAQSAQPAQKAKKAEHTLKFANNLPVTHPVNVRAAEMAAAISAETDGRVDLQIFPSSQLGSDTDTLSQVRSGGVEFFTLSGLILGTLVPAASITGLGFVFDDYNAVWKALDGDLGAHVRQEIEKANLVVMDKIWDNGFRQVTSSSKPIRTAADLQNFKIRVPVSPLWTSMFKALGASPASINFNEVYTALQTKVVDGEENPLAVISTAKLDEVQKFCSLTNHMWDGFWFLANKRTWEKLPAEVRGVVARHVNAAAIKERADVARLNASLQKDLSAKGMAFNQTTPDSFRARLREAGFYAEWKAKFGDQAWAILERSTKKLG